MKRLLIPIAVLVVAGCTDSVGPGPMARQILRQRLAVAEARWDANSPPSYEMTLAITCTNCGEMESAYRVTVEAGVITAATGLETDVPVHSPLLEGLVTIEDIFATIAREIEKPVRGLEVQYDATLGFPQVLVIDWSPSSYNEQTTIKVYDLVAH